MKIIPAEARHLQSLLALYRELFADMSCLRPDFFQAGGLTPAFLTSIMRSSQSDILAALDEEGEVVGFALVHARVTPDLDCFVPHRYANLEDISVTGGHRGQGVGRALLSAAEDWARARHLEFMELDVLSENLAARGLYETQGFTNFMQTMRHTL